MKIVGHWQGVPGRMDEVRQSPEFGKFTYTELGFPLIERSLVDAEYIMMNLRRYQVGYWGPNRFDKVWVHFFTDDYRFEKLWAKPWDGLNQIKRCAGVCSPDFSVYPEWPRVVNMWQVYRSRWLGRFWQLHDVPVIPTVQWSDQSSFAYCFDGIPINATVAITAPRRLKPVEMSRYVEGYDQMLRVLQPLGIIVYGKPDPMFNNHTAHYYVNPERPVNQIRVATKRPPKQTKSRTPL